ncbi:MAG: nitroreductase/quinone reductase family protein [Pseudomonadota bacterium]
MTTSPRTFPELIAPLNDMVIPGVRRGFANPWPLGTGLVLIEVMGRKSLITRKVPLVGTDYGSLVAVSTVRSESQWVKNLAANPAARLWLRGTPREVLARVYRDGARIDTGTADEGVSDALARQLSQTGLAVALLGYR